MTKSLFVIVLVLAVAGVVTAAWTTIASCPGDFGRNTRAAAVGNFAFFIDSANAWRYSSLDDTWTTMDTPPTTRSHNFVERSSPTSVLDLGGSSPTETFDIVEELTVDGVWATKSAMPSARIGSSTASDIDTNTVWVFGGHLAPLWSYGTWEYHPALDSWTTRADMPTFNEWSFAAYSYGNVYVLAYSKMEMYSTTLDVWTTSTSPPVERQNIYDGGTAQSGFIFVLGGQTGGSDMDFDKYDVAADIWSHLDNPPLAGGAIVILSTGLVISNGLNKNFNGYSTGLFLPSVASILQGDPLLSTHDGHSLHVNLRPGVFNVFASEKFVVNALAAHHADLPPEENMVVVAVGGKHSDREFVCYGSEGECKLSGHWVANKDYRRVKDDLFLFFEDSTFVVSRQNVEVTVLERDESFVAQYAHASYYDITVKWNPLSVSQPMQGLLADMNSEDRITTVTANILSGYYMSSEGSILDTDIPSVAAVARG